MPKKKRQYKRKKVVIFGRTRTCLSWNQFAGHRIYSFDNGYTWDDMPEVAYIKAEIYKGPMGLKKLA